MFEARDYQKRIHKKALDYIRQHIYKKNNNQIRTDIPATTLIVSPTGSGKTVMALHLAQELQYNTIWMAHRKELLNQAIDTNNNLFHIDMNVLSMFDRNIKCGLNKTLLIIDECQHAPSDSAINVVNTIKPDIIIGLTATPYRLDKAKLTFEKVITDAGIHQLIREGWLSQFHQYIIEGEWTPQNVVRMIMQSPDKWGKSISFWHSTAEAAKACELLKNNGIKAEVVTGSSPRDSIIEDFISGKLQHLTNCELLIEGFDVPDLATVFIRPASKGPTIQMAGRTLRKHPNKTHANIVQNQDTKYPFLNHATPKEKWLEINGIWKSLDSKNLDNIVNQMIAQKIQLI